MLQNVRSCFYPLKPCIIPPGLSLYYELEPQRIVSNVTGMCGELLPGGLEEAQQVHLHAHVPRGKHLHKLPTYLLPLFTFAYLFVSDPEYPGSAFL